MTSIWPPRAWAARATLTAIALAGFASVASAEIEYLVGVRVVTFAWQPSTGQVANYYVSRSLNGGPLESFTVVSANSVAVPVGSGEQVQISVRAAGVDSTGALRVGPASPISDPVKVLPSPRYSTAAELLLHCPTCPRVQLRPLSDASTIATVKIAPPMPWTVLGHAALDGGDTIIWHNTATGEFALWDWDTLDPIAIPRVTDLALRGVGAADLNRDGIEEFITQRTDTLAVSAWSLTSQGFKRVARLSNPPSSRLAAVRDFDRDGRVDLLWQNRFSGTLDLARFTANPVLGTGGAFVPSLTASQTTRLASGLPVSALVASDADYDGDGSRDVLLRYADGKLRILYLNSGAPDGWVWLPAAPDDLNRAVVDSRNIDGVSGAEIALQHGPTGEISIVKPTGQPARTVMLSAGSKWDAVATDL